MTDCCAGKRKENGILRLNPINGKDLRAPLTDTHDRIRPAGRRRRSRIHCYKGIVRGVAASRIGKDPTQQAIFQARIHTSYRKDIEADEIEVGIIGYVAPGPTTIL